MDSSWDSIPRSNLVLPEPKVGSGSGSRNRNRPRGVVSRSVEERDGVEFLVEVHAPEGGPPARRGKGRVGKYATPKMKTVVAAGSGSGLWDGTNIDRTLLNSCRRYSKVAAKYARKHGSLVDAPWHVIGKTSLFAAVRAARDFEAENCPPSEVQHVLDDWDMDLKKMAEDLANGLGWKG